MQAYVQTNTSPDTQTHTHAHTHTRIHAHVHTPPLSSLSHSRNTNGIKNFL